VVRRAAGELAWEECRRAPQKGTERFIVADVSAPIEFQQQKGHPAGDGLLHGLKLLSS